MTRHTTLSSQALGSTFMLAPRGMGITVSGFNDKLPALTIKVLECLRHHEIEPARVEVLRERLARQLRNAEFQPPYIQLSSLCAVLTCEAAFLACERLAQLANVTVESLTAHQKAFFEEISLEILVVGNMTAARASTLADDMLGALDCASASNSSRHTSKDGNSSEGSQSRLVPREYAASHLLPDGGCRLRYDYQLPDPQNINNAIDFRLEICQVVDLNARVTLAILAQLLKEPVFNTLRTKEQLGYVVGSSVSQLRGTLWLHFFVQSEDKPAYLEQRIEALLSVLHTWLRELSEAELAAACEVVRVNRREKFRNLAEESNHLWSEIASGFYHFSSRIDIGDKATAGTKQQVIEMYENLVIGSQRKLLSVHMHAASSVPLSERPKGARMARLLQTTADSRQVVVSDALREAAIANGPLHELNSEQLEILAEIEDAYEKNKELPIPEPRGSAISSPDKLRLVLPYSPAPQPICDINALVQTAASADCG